MYIIVRMAIDALQAGSSFLTTGVSQQAHSNSDGCLSTDAIQRHHDYVLAKAIVFILTRSAAKTTACFVGVNVTVAMVARRKV